MFDWWAEGIDVQEEPIALTKTADADVVCYQISNLLESSYASIAEFERDYSSFWRQVEHYFRALIVEGVKVHTTESKLEGDFLKQLDSLVDRIIFESQNEEDLKIMPVDRLILDDLNSCTADKMVTLGNFTAVKFGDVAFPNVLDYYLPVRPALDTALSTVVSPFARLYTLIGESID